MGERYVSTVKEERAHCPPKNVYFNLMKRLYRRKALEITEQATPDENDDSMLLSNTKVFGNEVELESQFTRNLPMPFVITSTKRMGTLFYKKGRNKGRTISIRYIDRLETNSRHEVRYWTCNLVDTTEVIEREQVIDYGVLLPQPGSPDIGIYTFITKSWSLENLGYYDFEKDGVEESQIESNNKLNLQQWTEGVMDGSEIEEAVLGLSGLSESSGWL